MEKRFKETNRCTFLENLPTGFLVPVDTVGSILLREYGSVFVAKGGVVPPRTVLFKDEAEISGFQSSLATARARIGSYYLELQTPAMEALKESIKDAALMNLSINPRDVDSARRSYRETVDLWESRVYPALTHWEANGRITQADADRIRSLSPHEQVPEIFKLEARGIWFAKDLKKSIIYSVAPPGTSQHLSMLAFDVVEYKNDAVCAILAKHRWYQTVTSDEPHFTFLGLPESELPSLGLKRVTTGDGRKFWVPDI